MTTQKILKNLAKVILKSLDLRVERGSSRVAQYDTSGIEMLAPLVLNLGNLLGVKPRVLQVGANDGENNDPLRPLIKAGVVKAILVEPMHEPFGKLQKLYADNSDITLENVAVSIGQPNLRLYSFQDASTGVPRFGPRTTSSRAAAERAFAKLKETLPAEATFDLEIIQTDYKAKTIKQILTDADWDDADVLILDMEGFDREVVLNTIESGQRFKVLLFERIFLTRDQYPDLLSELGAAGYGTATSGRDIIAVHDSYPRRLC